MASLESGRRLGPYEIVAPAGAGGMGEVYRAKDTRLDRTVAIKILPAHLAENEELQKRFEQEARAVSSLNHPHICTLYDIGHENGVHFMVMEYLDGETLAERLKRGAFPLAQALSYARQIADALDKAHRSGIVHRDLKPGNVMLTKDGVKLLDFGLAKLQARGVDPALSSLPTQNQPLTREGSIVGTLHYMAPEQLEGKDVDARADLFSLGAVLYEMVTGRRAFTGESPASIITSILSATPPPMTELVPFTPASLDRLVSSCLVKDREARWQSAGDLARELSWVTEEKATATAKRSSWVAWAIAGLLAVMTVGLVAFTLLRPRETPELVHFTISPPEGTSVGMFTTVSPPVVSPDGRRIAFAVQRGGATWLAVRALGTPEGELLTEVDRIPNLTWSPDGRSLLYRRTGKTMRLDLDSGASRVVGDSIGPGTSWSRNGTILSGQIAGAVRRLNDGELVTTLDEGELNHARPHFLPDGERFLFYVPSTKAIYLAALSSKDRGFVRSADSGAVYVEPGYLLFLDGQTLVAQRFDPSTGRVEGQPVSLARGMVSSPFGLGSFSASSDVLAYNEGTTDSRLEWFDREGRSLGAVGAPGPYEQVTLSPDGRRAVVDDRNRSLWVVDLERGGIASRLTLEEWRAGDNAWSPDGREIVMSALLSSSNDLYRLSLAAGSQPELVLSSERNLYVNQWLAADNQVAFHDGSMIGLLPMDGSGDPVELVRQEAHLDEPYRSPNGRWLAFTSQETARDEVYVERLDTRERSRVSSEGGGQPRWRRDGKELFYLSSDAKVMAVDFDTELGVQGVARPLFDAPTGPVVPTFAQWDVHPDGKRFLFLVPAGGERPIHVLLHWRRLLEATESP